MATFVFDSLADYGIDEDGGSLHDVIGKMTFDSILPFFNEFNYALGTRCDDYTYKLITGQDRFGSCHSYLREAIKEHNLEESDVHDVWNIFMCTGFTRVNKRMFYCFRFENVIFFQFQDTNQYFCKPSPAEKGDSIEFVAEMNLLVALSACPQGKLNIVIKISFDEIFSTRNRRCFATSWPICP